MSPLTWLFGALICGISAFILCVWSLLNPGNEALTYWRDKDRQERVQRWVAVLLSAGIVDLGVYFYLLW